MKRCGCWKDMGPGLANGESVVCRELWPSALIAPEVALIAPEVTLIGKISKTASWTPAPHFHLPTGQLYSGNPTAPQLGGHQTVVACPLWSPPGFFITMKSLTSLRAPDLMVILSHHSFQGSQALSILLFLLL